MPNFNRIANANILPMYFSYNATNGKLTPKRDNPIVDRIVRTINNSQIRIGTTSYSVHRLVWALHNPKDANPPYLIYKDGDKTNTRIENLEARQHPPRWENYQGQIPMRMLPDGTLVRAGDYKDAMTRYNAPQHTPTDASPTNAPRAAANTNPTPTANTPMTEDERKAAARAKLRALLQGKPN